MSAAYDTGLVDAFLAHHWRFRPVDATFMGASGHDDRLPPVGPTVLAEEIAGIDALLARLDGVAEPDAVGDRLDWRMMRSELQIARRAAVNRSRLDNPAWYSGEAAFGIISLLLPQSAPTNGKAVVARLKAIPDFLDAGARHLGQRAVPDGWCRRAQKECAAMAAFLRDDISLHQAHDGDWQAPADAAARAFETFAAAVNDLEDADPACGADDLSAVMRIQHGLDLTPEAAATLAQAAFDRMGEDLVELARDIDPDRTWQEIVASLSEIHPASEDGVLSLYRDLDHQALEASEGLVTPERGYGLEYRWMAPCFRNVSQALYFLFYRSPPGLDPGQGSIYWVTPPGADIAGFLAGNNVATVKTIHAVHHGSVGHHTQNARARNAASRIARVAGTDCAMGLAFLGAGTLIEGWACHVEDLMMEADGFYSPQEKLLLKQFERRNAASVLVDVRLHTGQWSMHEAMDFYRDEAGFAPARVAGEVVRNSMFPGSRLMYWLGVEGIRQMRRRWSGSVQAFHDELLSYGHVPLAWVADEMTRKGLLAA